MQILSPLWRTNPLETSLSGRSDDSHKRKTFERRPDPLVCRRVVLLFPDRHGLLILMQARWRAELSSGLVDRIRLRTRRVRMKGIHSAHGKVPSRTPKICVSLLEDLSKREVRTGREKRRK